jgi:hypothetical protein
MQSEQILLCPIPFAPPLLVIYQYVHNYMHMFLICIFFLTWATKTKEY